MVDSVFFFFLEGEKQRKMYKPLWEGMRNRILQRETVVEPERREVGQKTEGLKLVCRTSYVFTEHGSESYTVR